MPLDVAHAPQTPPANLEAEQALLGCVLTDNDSYHRTELAAEHFFEPFHGRLWEAISARIAKGQLADPITLAEAFKGDPGYEDLGGLRYFADLIDRAPPSVNAGDYAQAVTDAALRREIIRIGEGAAAEARGNPASAREQIEGLEQQLFGLAEDRRSQGFRFLSDYLTGAVEMAAEAYQRDGGISGIATGLADLDAKLGGLHPSDLIIIAARPSMGKSSLALNIAANVARRYRYQPGPDGSRKTIEGGRVGFFSLEMSGEQLALRLAADVSGVPGDKIRKGLIDASEYGRFRDASMEIGDLPLEIDDTGGLSLAKLLGRARRMKRLRGLDLLVIDYLQLIDAGIRGSAGRVEQVTVITTALKALAKELNVPVIALSQLSRQVEARDDKRPQLSDLRESGSIEQDADMVLFIYREEYYLKRSEPRPGTTDHDAWLGKMSEVQGLAEVIVGKQRHGPIGTVRLAFNEDLTKFTNLARDGHFAARRPYGDD